MKRVIVLLCVVFILAFSVSGAYAENTVELLAKCETVDRNRLFDVCIYANTDETLSAALVTLSYDSSVVEYRGVSSDVFEVEARDYGNKLQLIIASADGVKTNAQTPLINVNFKSICEGSFDMDLLCDQCIDDKLNELVVTTTSLIVTVGNDSVTAKSKTSKTSSSKNDTISGDKSEISSLNDDGNDIHTNDSINLSDRAENNTNAILYGVASGLVILLVFTLGNLFSKKRDDTKDKE